MKRLAGLLIGLSLALSAVVVVDGAQPFEPDAAQTDGEAGEPDLDEGDDMAADGLIDGDGLSCGVGAQRPFGGELGSAERGHASEIRFPPWG